MFIEPLKYTVGLNLSEKMVIISLMNVLFKKKIYFPHAGSTNISKTKSDEQATPCTILDIKSLWVCGSVYIYYIVLYHAVICELFN